MDSELPRQELIKCVLVGDNAVGKTRLICARAYNQRLSLSQLVTSHVPTVFAIDQYRIYKEVLENSWSIIDGVDVSLRLWDTFGDHHKDRRFAYSRSDVVLMCFDTSRYSSLENCRSMWYNQIKRFCPQTPIILVGCKNDMRFMYTDNQYLRMCKERSPLVRQIEEKDIVMPDQGRAVARDMGIPYIETSVLTFFGVIEVFESAIRAALCARRTQRFWINSLRRVMTPNLQEPFCPPCPDLPNSKEVPSSFSEDMLHLCEDSSTSDIIFLCGSIEFSAHKFLISAVSPLLHRLLTANLTSDIITRSNSETSLLSSNFGSSSILGEDTEWLLESDYSTTGHSYQNYLHPHSSPLCRPLLSTGKQPPRRSSFSGLLLNTKIKPDVFKSLGHPAFQSLHIQQCESLDVDGRGVKSVQTVLNCTKDISPQAFRQIRRFLYTGKIDTAEIVNIGIIKQAAELMELSSLVDYITNIIHKQTFLNDDLSVLNLKKIGVCLNSKCLEANNFSDIIFQLDDGTQAAHKPILMARCDMMQAMFSDDFLECSARIVKFPGVSRFTFKELLYYLYTDKPPRVTPDNCLGLIELANRLVLPRLVSLTEIEVIRQMELIISEEGGQVCQEALNLLQPCQIHNADQLSEWCLAYLAQNYNKVCKILPKVLRSLLPENQAALNIRRWPPIWYLKDFDLYQRMLCEQDRNERPKNLKRTGDQSGCLCFSQKSRKNST